ncbi:helix-turn-helix domain-containing protein [Planctomicrobium piriforme]|uniref:Helix-turn-helix n=1 Tax=Planctomicrobium piriforme TaxID=1576369 RepID=A0A1I3DFY2_9PLAN|nr:helix-turn-helix transcriptional regulator [Planctomicrobium piriforme]SFH85617.1 Helix-turn-helix [Planctomicrobium piriforme]
MSRQFQKLTRVVRAKPLTDEEATIAKRKRDAAQAEAPEVIAQFRAKQAALAFAAEIKSAREYQKLTLQQVADAAGMDVSNIAKLENGQRENPTIDTIFRVAGALGKQVELKLVDKAQSRS